MKYLPKLLSSQISFDLAQTILEGFSRVITGSFAKPRSTRNASSSAATGTGYRSARERSASSRMPSSMCRSRICHATWTACSIRGTFGEFDATFNFPIHVLSSLFFRNQAAYIVGERVNTLEYSEVALPLSRLDDALIKELETYAPSMNEYEGDTVVIRHLDIGCRMTPLNLYPQNGTDEQIDHGASRNMAMRSRN